MYLNACEDNCDPWDDSLLVFVELNKNNHFNKITLKQQTINLVVIV
jgi:hypothetical protein